MKKVSYKKQAFFLLFYPKLVICFIEKHPQETDSTWLEQQLHIPILPVVAP